MYFICFLPCSLIDRQRLGHHYEMHHSFCYIFLVLTSVVPHITDAVQEWVERVARIPVDGDNKTPEVCIVEVRMEWGIFAAAFFLLLELVYMYDFLKIILLFFFNRNILLKKCMYFKCITINAVVKITKYMFKFYSCILVCIVSNDLYHWILHFCFMNL